MPLRTVLVTMLALGATVFAFTSRASSSLSQSMAEQTDQHRFLQGAAGQWEGKLTMFTPGASEEAVATSETIESVGDYWTVSRFTCDFMGTAFVGIGSTGYDVGRKKFVGTWLDNMTTELAVMEGQIDPATKALVMRWEATDPMTGELGPHKVETLREGDTYTSTFFTGADPGVKSMQIVMKRKGAKPAGAK